MGIITSVGSLSKTANILKVSANSRLIDNLDSLAAVKINHIINGSKNHRCIIGKK